MNIETITEQALKLEPSFKSLYRRDIAGKFGL